ncbi:MAG: outer membrane lipoprotein carrier protein LolA, partial [Bacteroidota bacterium]
MKKLVVLLLAICSISFAQAQSAKSLLNEVSTKVKGYNNIVIDFKWNLNNSKEGVNQDTRGNVSIQGDKYLLNMLGTTRMFDGSKIYTIIPEDEEVTISNYTAEDDREITPSKL